MHKYKIIIEWSEDDNCFIGEVPELPGCMADGRTTNELIQNIDTAIEEWIDTATLLGREIPKPKGKSVCA